MYNSSTFVRHPQKTLTWYIAKSIVNFFTLSAGLFCTHIVASETDLIAQTKTDKITAVSEHWPPFQIVKEQKVIDGLSYDIVIAALKAANVEAEVKGFTWARSYKIAQEQANILIFSIARNPSREKQFKWVGEIVAIDNSLWRLSGREDIKINSLEDAKNFRIAVPRSDVRHEFLTSKGFKAPKHLDVVTSNEQTLKMLLRKRTDLIVANKLVLANLVNKLSIDASQFVQISTVNIYMGSLYIAFGPNTDDELVNKVSQGLISIKRNGTYDKLIDLWYNKLGPLGKDNTASVYKPRQYPSL